MVALKEPHLAELGWHDESQQGSVGNDNVMYRYSAFFLACQAPLEELSDTLYARNFVSFYRT
jgi:CO dehydrogenase/acetyl-CoA synthase gamma subunit (corrinoid Fe-S protein)